MFSCILYSELRVYGMIFSQCLSVTKTKFFLFHGIYWLFIATFIPEKYFQGLLHIVDASSLLLFFFGISMFTTSTDQRKTSQNQTKRKWESLLGVLIIVNYFCNLNLKQATLSVFQNNISLKQSYKISSTDITLLQGRLMFFDHHKYHLYFFSSLSARYEPRKSSSTVYYVIGTFIYHFLACIYNWQS